jgi:uncharacterized protein (DUF1778 family)
MGQPGLIHENEPESPSAVITVRMYPSMHSRIRRAARIKKISINRFCLSAIVAEVEAVEAAALADMAKITPGKDCQPEPEAA